MQKIEDGEGKSTNRLSDVQMGLDFLLRHFSKPPFPRNIARGATNKSQFDVDSEDAAMFHYQAALWEDLRVAAFGLGQKNPDLIFIDLDDIEALSQTLQSIERNIGGHPTVIWSGNGYHIIQPIRCFQPLENIKELAELEPEISKKFLQFAPRYLSSNKSDPSHNPSLNSCMLRVPGSINSKSKNRAVVKVLQEWDGYRPNYGQLFNSFYDYLLLKTKKWQQHKNKNNDANNNNKQAIKWVESLLHTPLADNRKYVLDLIVAPYLIVDRMLDEQAAYHIIMEWLDRCNQVERLTFNAHDRIIEKIKHAQRSQISHMSWRTMKERNPHLFAMLMNDKIMS